MYAPYFGLTQEPFSIAPDPRYLFMSERHREALAHLLYGLGGGGGFVLLTGEIGTGKTTVCRCFLEQIPDNCSVAYIFNPKLTVIELLQSVCDEFRIAVQPRQGAAPTVKDYLDPLNAFLLQAHAAGRNCVLIIDEAQNLSADVLEQLRLLTNLETSERKLLQIILIGQPELRQLLARPELEQLAQRVVARFHLGALTRDETVLYVRHRLEVAGLARAVPFEPAALERIHRLTQGVPRRVNLLCDRALLGAFAGGEPAVTRRIVDRAADEVFGEQARPQRTAWARTALVAGIALAIGAALAALALRGAPWERMAATGPAVPPAAVADTGAPEAGRDAVDATASAAEPAAPDPVPAAVPVAAAGPAAADGGAAPRAAPVLLRQEEQAWRELGQAWGLTAGAGEPCPQFLREQVHCFSRNMTLATIRELDRPGILMLDRGTVAPSYAVLTALGDRSATLQAGGTEQTVTLEALTSRWQGDWATLWRAPPGWDTRAPGREPPELVQWVRSRLPGAADERPGTTGWQQRIRAFQLAQGLIPDGYLGPLTLMQLNRTSGVDEPRLRRP